VDRSVDVLRETWSYRLGVDNVTSIPDPVFLFEKQYQKIKSDSLQRHLKVLKKYVNLPSEVKVEARLSRRSRSMGVALYAALSASRA